MAYNKDIYRAFKNAAYAQDNWKVLSWQILITAAITGILTESWIWFGITLVGLILLLRVPYIGAILCIILGSAVGAAAGCMAGYFGGATCGWVIGILVSLLMISSNFNAKNS